MSRRLALIAIAVLALASLSHAQTRVNGSTTIIPGPNAQMCFEPTPGAGPDVCIQRTGPNGLQQTNGVGNTGIPLGGGAPLSSIPGIPGLSAVPVQSGLMAEYRMLPTENPCALVDYSGNGNNATGCVGVSPTIIAGSGGATFAFNGAITLPAALNSALTVQIFMHPSTNSNGFAGSPIFGNGATLTSVSGLDIVPASVNVFVALNLVPTPGTAHLTSTIGNDNQGTVLRSPLRGNVNLVWAMDTLDNFYVNGTLMTTTTTGNGGFWAQSRSMAGVQTSGVFQLGGVSASHFGQPANNAYFNGLIYYAVFYNRVLTAAEVAANTNFINNAMTSRGVVPSTFDPLFTGDSLVLDGDSLTVGCCQNPITPYTLYTVFQPSGSWNVFNQGLNGMFMGFNNGAFSGLIAGAPYTVDPLYGPSGGRNTVVVWGGVNDNAVGAESGLDGYCRARRVIGWKCIAVSMMSHTGADAFKNTYDTWMRLNWRSFADGFIDVASDPLLGADGASTNATWFNAGLHLFTQGYANLIAPIIQRGVNRFHGNNDFTSATTYVAAASAAVATTAGTMSGNTATITFAATPANCLQGNQIVLAGITPAGYNSPAGHGWQILTRTATQITFYNSVSALGAITVQGTGVCPQQQDVDTYSILNFGAGNFTLESCMGYTGQNIYIQNINATASTLVPFASETITGAGATPTTLAANTTAILQSTLVSSSAAGCSWVRIQ